MKQKLLTIYIVLLSLVSIAILFAFFIGIGNYFKNHNHIIVGNIFMLLFLITTYLGVIIFHKKINFLLPRSYGFGLKNFFKNILIGAILALIIISLALIIAKTIFDIPFKFVILKNNFEKPLLVLVFSTIGVSIWEEFFFRGLIYNTLLKNSFGFHFSALISSVLFSLTHIFSFDMSITSWIWYIGIVFIGYILVFVYSITTSIWTVVSLHFIWDFLSGLIDKQHNKIGLFEIQDYIEYSGILEKIIVFILGLIVFIIIYLSGKKQISKKLKMYTTQLKTETTINEKQNLN